MTNEWYAELREMSLFELRREQAWLCCEKAHAEGVLDRLSIFSRDPEQSVEARALINDIVAMQFAQDAINQAITNRIEMITS